MSRKIAAGKPFAKTDEVWSDKPAVPVTGYKNRETLVIQWELLIL